MSRLRRHPRARVLAPCLACVLAVFVAAPTTASRAGTPPTYRIDVHAISAGGVSLRGRCYRLSATVGQVATGHSSVDLYSLIAGYWQSPPPAATDEIFFNEFEVC